MHDSILNISVCLKFAPIMFNLWIQISNSKVIVFLVGWFMSTQKSRNIFVEELCKYFMDFLQTGFKSTRFPKRYIRLNNEKNFKIGIDLSKYENFNESIRKVLNKPEAFQQEISVKKGTHTVKLNNTSIDLLKKLTKQIKDKDIEKLFYFLLKQLKNLRYHIEINQMKLMMRLMKLSRKNLQK